MALTPRQRRFVEEYLVDLNISAAMRRAGYKTPDTARMMRSPEVAAAIAKGMAERSERTRITADAVLVELARIGFSNILDYTRVGADGDLMVDLTALDRDKAAAISEVIVEDFKDSRAKDARECRRVRFKLMDKRAALVDLGKHLGIFRDNRATAAPQSEPVDCIILAGPER